MCHRRWGKDDVALHWAAASMYDRPASYWHMLPEYAQARRVMWNAVNARTGKRRIDEAFPPELRASTQEQEMLIKMRNGATWQLVGSDQYDSLVGAGVAGITFSEWSLANPSAWAYLSPMLVENEGWALFIYTSRGRNHGYTLYERALNDPEWFALRHTVDDTGALSADAVAAAKKDYQALYGDDDGQALWRQEYYCDFDAAVLGAFYGSEMRTAEEEGRITNVPYDPGLPVYTAWDLGFTDSTAIWFIQVAGREIHLVDYEEANSKSLSEYVHILDERRRKYKFVYRNHYFPHDVGVHELSTGKSRLRTLQELGLTPTVVPQHMVMDGINAVRLLFPRMWFDKRRCERGIHAIRSYRREYDEKVRMYRQRPLHDWTSHGSDALRSFAAGFPDTHVRIVTDSYREPDDYDSAGRSHMSV